MANPFGLVGLFFGEWCEDLWYEYSERSDYSDSPVNNLPVVGEQMYYITRGGAAVSYPWQGCGEWISCISAIREPNIGDNAIAGRFVKVLNLNSLSIL